MAGGFGSKIDPKSKNLIKNNNGEILKDSPSVKSSPNILSGILFPGQSIDINKNTEKSQINWDREFLFKTVDQEQTIFVNQHSQEIKKEIEELRIEIKKLIQVTENIDSQIENSIDQNISEFNEYQLNFFQRIKNFIINFRKNISEAGIWIESFSRRKSKRNAFWNRARDHKSGGEQYLFSGEHSASRSAN